MNRHTERGVARFVFPLNRSLLVSVLLGLTVVVGGTLAWVWLPAVARDRIVGELAVRDMAAEIGAVSPSVDGLRLADVALTHRTTAATAHLEAIHVHFSWWDAVWERGRAVRSIAIEGGRVTLPLESDLAAYVRQSRPGASSAASRGSREPWFQVQISDLSVVVEDAYGEIAVAEGVVARQRERGDWELGSEAVQLFAGSPEELSLSRVRLVIGSRPWQLSSLTSESGRLTVRDSEIAGWRQRLREAFSGLAGLPDAEMPGADEASPGASSGPSWMARLSGDARVRFNDLDVDSERHAEESLARGVSVELERMEGNRVRAAGRGTLPAGGNLEWDLTLTPGESRAEGRLSFERLPFSLAVPFLPRLPWYEPDRASVDGDVEIASAAPGESLSFDASIRLHALALASPRLAPEPVTGIDIGVRGAGVWDPLAHHLTLADAEVQSGDATLQISGEMSWSAPDWSVQLAARLPPTSCQAAIHAIPRGLLGETASLSMAGQLAGTASLHLDSRDLDSTELELDVDDGCEFVAAPAIADLGRIEGPFEHRVLEPDGTWFEMTTGPGTGSWTSIYATSPFLVHAVLAHEDASFFRHSGFAPWAIRDALVRNLEEGRFVYGASTISMQLAKNLFLHREKTLARKVQEVLLTWWLERSLEKHEILEVYLNIIEYGPAVYGLRQAAWHFFGRDPIELSPAESAFFANVLPAPKRFYDSYERGRLTSSMRGRVERFLRHMRSRDRLDDAALAFGLGELEQLRFRPEDGGRAEPRRVDGTAATLPFEAEEDWGDLDGWESLSEWAFGDDFAEGG